MQRGTKSELQMLREVGWLILSQNTCFFCHRKLLERPPSMTFGHRRHPPIEARITVHHDDKNRENNTDANLKFSHKLCHVAFHANERRMSDDEPDSSDS
jgi:hypothetical protein